MAVEEVVSIPAKLIFGIIEVSLWLETLGVILLLWVVLFVISFFINLKKLREVLEIKKDIQRLETKIDKILKKS